MLNFSLMMTIVMYLTMIGFGFLFVNKPPKEIKLTEIALRKIFDKKGIRK